MKRIYFHLAILLTLSVAIASCSNLDESAFKPTPDTAEKTLLSATFESDMGGFITKSISGEQEWKLDSTYKCMTVSGFVLATKTYYANEDWLISSKIDLSGCTTANVSFDHAGKLLGNPKEDATLWVVENNAGTVPSFDKWTQLQIPNMFTNSDYTFVNSGQISLTAFAGKKIRLALKYLSTTTAAGTWEVKNFLVKTGEASVTDYGKGTKDAPYTVTGALQNQTATNAWVKGYIVGYVWSGATTNFYFSSDTCSQATNLLIADSTSNIYQSRCLIVKLPAGIIRSKLNLVDNKNLLGKEISVYGLMQNSNNSPSLKFTSSCVIQQNDYVDPEVPPTGDGKEKTPYNVSAATLNQNGFSWVTGYIVGNVDGQGMNISTESNFSTPFNVNTNILIAASPDENDYSMCIPVQLPSGIIRDSLNLKSNNKLHRGKVKIYGSLEKFFGVAGLKTVSYAILPNGTTVGTKPFDPTTAKYYETFATSLGSFTTYNVLGAQVWANDATYKCAKMSGYSGSKIANEDWLVSPEINLVNTVNPVLSFEHAGKFFGTLSNETTLWISEDYASGDPKAATWTQLSIPVNVTNKDYTFMGSGDINLGGYVGKKVRIAFKYVSNTTYAGTWEIKNFMIQ